jgi:hypothetical protein
MNIVPASDIANPDDEDEWLQFVFNSNARITSRKMKRTWSGAYDAEALVLGYKELHAEQVDRDRDLAQEMDEDHPVFVRLLIFFILSGSNFLYSLFLQVKWRTCIGICVPDTASTPTAIT